MDIRKDHDWAQQVASSFLNNHPASSGIPVSAALEDAAKIADGSLEAEDERKGSGPNRTLASEAAVDARVAKPAESPTLPAKPTETEKDGGEPAAVSAP